MSHPPTQTEIRAILEEAGLRPHKRYGQHFLIDGNLMRMVVDAAELEPEDTVLEVGPGIGNMTELLVERAGHVVAVEVDPAIAAVARERLAGAANLDLIVADILADKHTVSPEALELLRRSARPQGAVKLVANLPYAAATPLVAELVQLAEPPERLVFTVQEEVALRLVAEPGTREYGPVGVLVQAVAEVEILRRLGPSVFWPRPAVWSSLVRVWPRAHLRRRIADLGALHMILAGLFGHRRKRAARSLSLADPSGATAVEWASRLSAAGLDPEARGEVYTVEEIIRLANGTTSAKPEGDV
jgi:16S rRNA (adenine1518-N6/adenine1519-N6)-dimethyltransferase